ncbi:choice-of-anchor G family protein, partial [Gulosibacter faecalis]
MRWLGGLAAGVAAVLAFASTGLTTTAAAADAVYSEAYAEVLNLNAIGADVAEAASAHQQFPPAASNGAKYNQLNVALLNEIIQADLGGTLNGIPLISDANGSGLIYLGELGAAHSYASAADETTATASSGVITEDGAIAVSPEQATGDPARVNLTSLLDQLTVSDLTDAIIDEASLEIGALASRIEKSNGTVTPEYVVAGADLVISSPLVGGLVTDLGDTVDGLGTTLDGLLSTDGTLGTLISQLEVLNINLGLLGIPLATVAVDDATVGVTGIDSALTYVNEQ